MATLPLHTLPNQYSDLANSVAADSNGNLCIVYKGQLDDNQVYISLNDDQGVPNWTWSGPNTIPNVLTKYSPSVTYFGERLFVAWINDNNCVCYTFSDDNGSSFGYTVVLENTSSKSAPCLSGGKSLFISYTGTDRNIHVMSVG